MQLSPILIAILFGLGAMIGWGSADFFAKKATEKVGYAISMFYMQTFGLIPLALIIILSPTIQIERISPSILVQISVFALVYIIAYLFLYLVFEKGKLSIVSPIGSTWSALSVFISVFIFKEPLNSWILIWLFVIIAGILILSTDIQALRKDIKNIKNLKAGVVFALLEAIIMGIYFPVYNHFLESLSLNTFYLLFIFRIFTTIFAFIYVKIKKISITKIDKQTLMLLLLIGFLDIFAYTSLTFGLALTPYTSIVTVLSATFTIPTIIFAKIFLKEKITKEQLVGIALIVAGIVFLVG